MSTLAKKTALSFSLVTLFMALSIAQPRQGKGFGPYHEQNFQRQKGHQIENIIPNLTEDQKETLKDLHLSYLKEMRDFRNQIEEIKAKQRTIMSGNPIDEKAAGNLIDQKTQFLNKQMKAQIAHKAAVQKVFTEEQLQAIENFQIHRQMASKHGRRGPANGPCQGNCPRQNGFQRNM